jgi:hypothetical protein
MINSFRCKETARIAAGRMSNGDAHQVEVTDYH